MSTSPQGLPSYLVLRALPPALQELERRGELARLEEVLATVCSQTSQPPDQVTFRELSLDPRLAAHELERLRRLRREFSLSPQEFLEKVRTQVPSASLHDVEEWLASGKLQAVYLNGRPRIFRREPANLFRFADDVAKRRRFVPTPSTVSGASHLGDPSDRPSTTFTLNTHLQALVTTWRETGSSTPHRVRIRATHTLAVKEGIVPAGATLRCWLPYPRATLVQSEPQLIAADPAPLRIAPSDAGQRTLYFERPASAHGETTFSITFEYTTSAWLPLLAKSPTPAPLTPAACAPYLREQPPHIVFAPEIRSLATQITGTESDPLERARRIFSWIVGNIRYASEMEYCVMPCIVEKVLATRRGDCGVQTLLFITLCRAAGIPARWVSGWVVYPSGWNMHDWAEFYVEPYGWLPADCSRGWREDEDPDVRQFFFGNSDAYRMIANVEACAPFDPPTKHWRSDPVDNQRGEVQWEGGNLYYDDWRYEVSVTSELVDPSAASR